MSLRDRIGPEGMQAAEHRYAVEKAAAALTITEKFKQMVDYKSIGDEMKIARWMVEAFDAAGLLVTPEHDAAVLEAAAADASNHLGWEGGGHTSVYSVRRWLQERAKKCRDE